MRSKKIEKDGEKGTSRKWEKDEGREAKMCSRERQKNGIERKRGERGEGREWEGHKDRDGAGDREGEKDTLGGTIKVRRVVNFGEREETD